MKITCPDCSHQFQFLDPDSRRFTEQVMHDCIETASELDKVKAVLEDLIGEAGRIDSNIKIHGEFWNAYHAASDILSKLKSV